MSTRTLAWLIFAGIVYFLWWSFRRAAGLP